MSSGFTIAPGATIILLEYNSTPGNTPGNNLNNFFSAVQTARSLPGVSVVSMSLGLFKDDNKFNTYKTSTGKKPTNTSRRTWIHCSPHRPGTP